VTRSYWGIVGVVELADFIGDKVPVVDHVLHLIGTVVAPVVGGVLAFASATAFDVSPGLAVPMGVAAALATQVGRTAARPVSTVTTGVAGIPS
jgi:C4-dicarboxylate transporter